MPQINWIEEAKKTSAQQEAQPSPGVDWVAEARKVIGQAQAQELPPVEAALAAGKQVQPGSAGPVANFKTGLADDPQTDINIYAKAVFPDLPLEEARKRFSVVNGRVLYLDKDGNVKRPDAGFIAGASEFAGESGLPIVGGIAGGIFGTPLVGGALGAAAGEGARDIFRQAFLGEEQTTGEFLKSVGTEGAVDLAFGKLFDVVGKGFRTRALRNIENIDEKQISQMQKEVFERTGIKLDIAQITGLGQLRQLKTFITKNPSSAQDIVRAFDDLQKGQVEDAVNGIISMVARSDAAIESLGIKGVNAAGAAISTAKATRRAQTQPLYRAAFGSGAAADPSDIIKYLDDEIKSAKGPVKQSLLAAKKMLYSEGDKVDTSIEGLHGAKVAIDAMIEGGQKGDTAVSSFTVGKLVDVNKQITALLESVSEEYKAAQALYKKLTREVVQPLQDSIVGVIANVSNERAANVSAKLFSGNVIQSPENMRMARMAIQQVEKNSPEYAGAWDGMIAQYLSNASDKALKDTITGNSASLANRYRKTIAGTPRARAVMREAFGGGQEGAERMRQFDFVMDALDKVASTPTAASDTQSFQQIQRSLQSSLRNAGLYIVSPLDSIKGVLLDSSVDKALVNTAEALLDPKKALAIRALKSMKPSVERNLIIAGVVTGSLAIDSVENFLSEPLEDTR